MKESLIVAGGVFNISFAAFHVLFWRLFDWKNDLSSLSLINKNIMQVLNLCLTFVFLIFAYLSLFHTEELLSTNIGHSILVLVCIFWLLRAIEQVVFFKLKTILSRTFLVIFLAGTTLYGIPAMSFID